MLLKSQALGVLEYLNSVNYVPTLAETGRAVGLSPPTVWRILRDLRDLGIRFKSVVDLGRLGLVEVLLIYKTRIPPSRVPRKLLRSYVGTLEGATFLKYVSTAHEVESAVNYVVDSLGVEPSEVYVIDAVAPPRYLLTLVARGALDRLYPRDLIAMASAAPPSGRPRIAGRADLIDIALVNRLEEDALVKVKEVYNDMKRRLGRAPSYQTVLRHLREHLVGRGAIAGLRPTIENYVEKVATSTRKLLILYGVPGPLAKGVRAVTAIPAFAEAYLNTKEGVAYATGSIPVDLVPRLASFLRILESRGLVGEWKLLEIDPSSVPRLPIPEALGVMSVAEVLAADRVPGAGARTGSSLKSSGP